MTLALLRRYMSGRYDVPGLVALVAIGLLVIYAIDAKATASVLFAIFWCAMPAAFFGRRFARFCASPGAPLLPGFTQAHLALLVPMTVALLIVPAAILAMIYGPVVGAYAAMVICAYFCVSVDRRLSLVPSMAILAPLLFSNDPVSPVHTLAAPVSAVLTTALLAVAVALVWHAFRVTRRHKYSATFSKSNDPARATQPFSSWLDQALSGLAAPSLARLRQQSYRPRSPRQQGELLRLTLRHGGLHSGLYLVFCLTFGLGAAVIARWAEETVTVLPLLMLVYVTLMLTAITGVALPLAAKRQNWRQYALRLGGTGQAALARATGWMFVGQSGRFFFAAVAGLWLACVLSGGELSAADTTRATLWLTQSAIAALAISLWVLVARRFNELLGGLLGIMTICATAVGATRRFWTDQAAAAAGDVMALGLPFVVISVVSASALAFAIWRNLNAANSGVQLGTR